MTKQEIEKQKDNIHELIHRVWDLQIGQDNKGHYVGCLKVILDAFNKEPVTQDLEHLK
jgi:hypothetical protein